MVCEINNVVKTYPSFSGGGPQVVLNGVSLSIDRGESVAVVGPSGSGKTTLLHIAAGLDRPDGGKVFIDACDITDMFEDELARMRNRRIGALFQRDYLLPHCTLLENVLVPTLPYPDAQERLLLRQRAENLLERLGLLERLDSFPRQLSGGERQRAALARALINCPSFLCADEPAGSLDRAATDEMGQLLRDINKEEQTALLLVTHSEEMAARMDKVFVLNDGKLGVRRR